MRLLFSILVLLPIIGYAENYFKNGMKWEYEIYNSDPNYKHVYNYTYTLEGDTIVDGFEVSKMYEYCEDNTPAKRFKALIRTKGDRVLLKYDYPGEKWYLIYDFGLVPGEECTVDRISVTTEKYHSHFSDWVKCVSVGESTDYPGFPSLTIGDIESFAGYGVYGEWLVGVGSTRFFDTGGMINACGGGSRLMRASFNGNVICEYKTNGIESVEVAEGPVSIYCADGLMIYQGSVTKENLHDIIQKSGVYIVKSGTSVKKIAVDK